LAMIGSLRQFRRVSVSRALALTLADAALDRFTAGAESLQAVQRRVYGWMRATGR